MIVQKMNITGFRGHIESQGTHGSIISGDRRRSSKDTRDIQGHFEQGHTGTRSGAPGTLREAPGTGSRDTEVWGHSFRDARGLRDTILGTNP